jgi:hypothetical protein
MWFYGAQEAAPRFILVALAEHFVPARLARLAASAKIFLLLVGE